MEGLIGIATSQKNGLMQAQSVPVMLGKPENKKVKILIKTLNKGQSYQGLLSLIGITGDMAAIVISINRWNATKIFATKINGVIPSSVKLFYTIEDNGDVSIYIDTLAYINVNLTPSIYNAMWSISLADSIPNNVESIII